MISSGRVQGQKKREKELKEQMSKMCIGDTVVTIGGLIGRVANIKDDEVTIIHVVDENKTTKELLKDFMTTSRLPFSATESTGSRNGSLTQRRSCLGT